MRALAKYVLGASVKLVVSAFAVSVVIFLVTTALGDTARAVLGRDVDEEQLAAFRRLHGLDRPLLIQYGTWVANFGRGDWGISYASGDPVVVTVVPRLKRSLVLAAAGFLLTVVFGLAIGLVSGQRAGTRADAVVSVVTLIVASLPEFLTSLLLMVVFAARLRWFPVDSTAVAFASSARDMLRAYALPALSVALILGPYVVRLTRANTREVVAEPFIRAAVLRGVGWMSLTFRHLLPNVAPPVVHTMALLLAGLLTGVVSVEAVFGFPGMGQLLVHAVSVRDLPVVQAITFIVGVSLVLLNLVADGIVLLLTPRLRTRHR